MLLDLANHVIPILPRTSLGKSLGQKSQFLRSDK